MRLSPSVPADAVCGTTLSQMNQAHEESQTWLLGRRAWTAAIVLAVLAPIVFLTEPAGAPSWAAVILVAPFSVLALWRAELADSRLGGDGTGAAGPGDAC
jgi:hypothetical protein